MLLRYYGASSGKVPPQVAKKLSVCLAEHTRPHGKKLINLDIAMFCHLMLSQRSCVDALSLDLNINFFDLHRNCRIMFPCDVNIYTMLAPYIVTEYSIPAAELRLRDPLTGTMLHPKILALTRPINSISRI